MDSINFFADMRRISDYLFNMWTLIWSAMMSNLILTLSFAITIVGFVFAILRKIKHIRK